MFTCSSRPKTSDGFSLKVADWVPQDGLTFIKELDPKGEPDEALEQDEGLNNRVLVVTTIQVSRSSISTGESL